MIEIKVPLYNDSLSTIAVDDKEYLLHMSYNMSEDSWSMGLLTKDNVPIISGMKIVPNYWINEFYRQADMPKGNFIVQSPKDTVGRYDFRDGIAKMLYFSKKELLEMWGLEAEE